MVFVRAVMFANRPDGCYARPRRAPAPARSPFGPLQATAGPGAGCSGKGGQALLQAAPFVGEPRVQHRVGRTAAGRPPVGDLERGAVDRGQVVRSAPFPAQHAARVG